MGLLITVVGPRGNTFSTASFISSNNVHFFNFEEKMRLGFADILSDQFVGLFSSISHKSDKEGSLLWN